MDEAGTATITQLRWVLNALPGQLIEVGEASAMVVAHAIVAGYGEIIQTLDLQPDGCMQIPDLRHSPFGGIAGIDVRAERNAQWLLVLSNAWSTMGLSRGQVELLPAAIGRLVADLTGAMRTVGIESAAATPSAATTLVSSG
jgi:hypothetical protein